MRDNCYCVQFKRVCSLCRQQCTVTERCDCQRKGFRPGDRVVALKEVRFFDQTAHRKGQLVTVTEISEAYYNNPDNSPNYLKVVE